MSPIFAGSQSGEARTEPVFFRAPLLSGEQGTAQTIRLMRQLVDEALADSKFVRMTIDILRSVPAFDDIGEAEALFNWVRRNIRFTKDPLTKEKLYPPQELLKIRAGDCDDISMLLGAMLLAVGYPARLVTVSANPNNPSEFSHVYVEGEIPAGSGRWIPMDAARFNSKFGAEPPAYFRKRAWSLTDDNYQDLAGLGNYGTVGDFMDPSGGFNWGNVLQQSIQEIPAIIATVRGGGSTFQTPVGSGQTSPNPYANPYGSYMTPYTPGYGIPPAGYNSSSIFASSSGSVWPWIIGGGLVLLLMRRH